ncbi:UNVERIFIED_CONTAM: hypothetical protein Scaly_2190400 [Sesamum calycinum]|uniref:Zinc-finger domain-containing protein n=1 Tax=Sesamum calycinum TaxID=2727403 RepID=A0AAW2MQ59_9LAMI
MVSTRSRGRTQQPEKNKQEEEEEATTAAGGGNANRTKYEESRAQRIKENTERMKSLGIFDLSKNLKPPSSKPSSSSLANPRPHPHLLIILPGAPLGTLSLFFAVWRLKDMPRVSYSENKPPKKEDSVKDVEIHIPDGEKPEIYTEEHEKLLGDSKAVWTLLVDGYDEDGQRIYDPVEGKTCHQCRQKTLGRHTECSKCERWSLAVCGDCLYMRHGPFSFDPVYPGMGRTLWKLMRIEIGSAPYVVEFAIAVAAEERKDGSQLEQSTRRLPVLVSNPWRITSFTLVVNKQSCKWQLPKIQFLLMDHSADDKVQEPSDTLSLSLFVGKSNEMEEDDWEIDNESRNLEDDHEEDDGDIDIEIASQ